MTKCRCCKIIVSYISTFVFVAGVICFGLLVKCGDLGIYLLQFIIGIFFISMSISLSLDKDIGGKNMFAMTIVANILFAISSTIFLLPSDLKKLPFQIINPIFILLMVILLYIVMVCCKIKGVIGQKNIKELVIPYFLIINVRNSPSYFLGNQPAGAVMSLPL
jgi:hypothetical protein